MSWSISDLQVLVHATTWSLFSIATIFLGVRVYSRLRNVGIALQADDWVLISGWLFVLLTSANLSWLVEIFVSPTGGLFRVTLARVHMNLQAAALALTKTSFGITLLRLMPGGWEGKIIWVVLVTMNLQFSIHMIASWQAICGAPDQGHIGSGCWELSQSVAFAVFSALYSAFCDFILALLPWKMIFNLQMKQSDRVGVAVALSFGFIAGVTGIVKAVYGLRLVELNSPDYIYNQSVYWIWSMAEPNVTIMSASIPVLRGFVKNVRNRSNPSYGAGNYVQTGDSTNTFYNRSTVTAAKRQPKDHDGASETSILGKGESDGSRGIMWTTEVTIEHETSSDVGIAKTKGETQKDHYELDDMPPRH